MEYLPYIFALVLVILTTILAVVGFQLVQVLIELRRTLRKVNETLDTIDATVTAVTQPLHSLGGMASGLNSGFKVFETFVSWLNRNKE